MLSLSAYSLITIINLLFSGFLQLGVTTKCLNFIASSGTTGEVKFVNEVFNVDTLILHVPLEHDYGYITSICLGPNETILISYYRDSSIYQYNANGSFLRKIGRKGQGPGEFQRPWYIVTDKDDDIYIGDFLSRRITQFDSYGNFKRIIQLSQMINGLVITENAIFINDYINAVYNAENNIYCFDREGVCNNKFGELSQTGKLLKNFPFRPQGPYLSFFNDNIYHSDYADYSIRKYNLDGKLIETFNSKPEFWESPAKADCKKLPNPQTVTPDLMKVFKQFQNKFDQYTIANWINVISPGLVVQCIKKTSSPILDSTIIVYDLDGHILHKGLKFFQYKKDNQITGLLPLQNSGFCYYFVDLCLEEKKYVDLTMFLYRWNEVK
ncbi:6-bladed beta-propeller [bacterium]|nr:6-bladed beta-propeller [bacterium]